MKTQTKVALVTAAVGIPAFFLGPVLLPPADVGVEPTAGFPVIRKVSPDSKVRAWAMYLSIGYLMVSWWPHLNMHASNGIDFQGLLYIDLFFHLPLEVAGVALALSFISLMRTRTAEVPADGEMASATESPALAK